MFSITVGAALWQAYVPHMGEETEDFGVDNPMDEITWEPEL